MYWILILAGVLVALLLLWPTLKKWLPASWVGTATQIIDAASHSSTDAVLIAGEQAMLIAGWEADDTVYMDLVRALRERRRSWATPVTPVPIVGPTVETLAADVAILRSVLASQSTSTIPPSAVNNV
jgi:hypothetical protein